MNRLRPDESDARFVRRIVLILLILAIAAALFRAGNLMILAFGSVLGAIVIHAIADLYADHLPLGPKRSLTLSIVTVLAVLGFLAWLFGVAFRQQLNTLVTQLPILLDQLAGWASQSPVGAKIVDAVRAAQIETAQNFNFTPYVLAGLLFVLLALPMIRLTDWYTARLRAREQIGSIV